MVQQEAAREDIALALSEWLRKKAEAIDQELRDEVRDEVIEEVRKEVRKEVLEEAARHRILGDRADNDDREGLREAAQELISKASHG